MTGIVRAGALLQPLSCSSASPSLSSPSHISTAFVTRLPLPFLTLNSSGRCSSRLLPCFWEPVVVGVRVAPRGGALSVEEEEEEEDFLDEEGGLSLYEEELGFEDEGDEEGEEEEEVGAAVAEGEKVRRTFRLLGNKEKKELRAYAHKLGNDICLHQVGKWGVTANCVTAISDALEANELIKVRVLDNLDEELDDTVRQLETKSGAQIVGRIGRTLLLYRPSIRKLKAAQAAEEKAFKNQKRRSSTTSSRWKSKSSPGAPRGQR